MIAVILIFDVVVAASWFTARHARMRRLEPGFWDNVSTPDY